MKTVLTMISCLILLLVIIVVNEGLSQTLDEKKWLEDFATQQAQIWQQQRAKAESIAVKLNLPIRQEFPDGSVIELQRFENSRPIYYQTHNINAARTISTNLVWPGGAGFSLTGTGIILGIWDAGRVLNGHQELTGRVTQKDASTSDNDHATHVAGTMIASGIQANAKGMAYQATLDAYDWNNDQSEMITAASAGLRVSNHSYGIITGWHTTDNGSTWDWYGDPTVNASEDYNFGFYSNEAQNWDAIAFNAPNYLIVRSAGNDRNQGPASQPVTHRHFGYGSFTCTHNLDGTPNGYDCISHSGVAKNVLTIGAVNDIPNGYSNPNNVVMSSFSSWGPTDDGRIKPDVVANGIGVYSTLSTSNISYGNMSGTSMAAPSVSGSIGLLLQHWQSLYGGEPRSATLKALIIHTADEAGQSPGPDYRFGWGLMNTAKAAQLMSLDMSLGGNVYLKKLTLNNSEIINFSVYSNGSEPLRATICWTDPAGTPTVPAVDPPTKMLVNDLDLRIIQGSSTFFPWTLNPSNPSESATTGDNNRDNVEQVFISSPIAGNYTVRVTHKGTLSTGSQKFSLIISGGSPSTISGSPWTMRFNNEIVNKIEDMGFKIPIGAKRMTRNLAVDTDGNVYVAGYSDGGPTTKMDYVTIKYNSNGTLGWIRRYNGTGNGDDKAYSLAIDGSGNVYVTGESNRGTTGIDITTISYDNAGNLRWVQHYSGPQKDAGYAIAIAPSGTYVYVTGETKVGNSVDYITLAYETAPPGNLLSGWPKFYNGLGNNVDKAYAITVSTSGNVFVTGESNGGTTQADYATIKYNGITGEQLWLLRYNAVSKKDYAFAIKTDLYENVYVTGASEGATTKFDYATVKYSSAGSEVWVARYNHIASKNDYGSDLVLDSEGNVYVTGASEGANTKLDYTTVKYNKTDGTQLWINRYELLKNDIARSIDICDIENVVLVTGSSDQGTGRKLDFLTQKINANTGATVWVGRYNGTGNKDDIAYNIKVRPADCGIVITGTSVGLTTKIDFSTIKGISGAPVPTPITTPVIYDDEEGEEGMPVVHKLTQNYPNPFNPITTIEFRLSEQAYVTLKVYNVLGQEVVTLLDKELLDFGTQEIIFNAQNLSSGVYFYRLITENIGNDDEEIIRETFIQVKKMLLLK